MFKRQRALGYEGAFDYFEVMESLQPQHGSRQNIAMALQPTGC
jgi:hypothetical protein